MTYDPRLSGSVLTIGVASSELPARTNASGASVTRTNPIRLDSNGDIQRVDPSIEAHVLACVGVAKDSVANSALCGIVTSGRLVDVTVPGSLGDTLFLSKTGTLTNLKPSIGVDGFVSGDFVLSIGIVVKNQDNPLLSDLLINIRLVGQL
jgi:hypothetical protein